MQPMLQKPKSSQGRTSYAMIKPRSEALKVK